MSLLDDLPKGRWDVPFFAERFFGVKTHAGQNELFEKIVMRDMTGWRAAYLTICATSGNQAGKTLGLSLAIMHSAIYKMNLAPPDWYDEGNVRSWMRAPYDWWHFGIQQEVAELAYNQMTQLFESRHPAQQGRDCPLTTELGPEIVDYSKKERGEYQWVRFSPMIGGSEIHFRSTTEKGIGTLGKSMQGVSMDECGFENNLPFIVNEVFHLRRIATGGQMLLISTPSEGYTAFSDEWEKGNPKNPLRVPGHMSVRMSTRQNVGYGIDIETFNSLVASMPPELIPQNIDGEFIQGSKSFFNAGAVDAAFRADLPAKSLPQNDHRYINGLDPALNYDNTFIVTLDVTDRNNVVGVDIKRLQGKQQTITVVGLAHDQHAAYVANGATCTTGVDVTGYGGKMMREMLSGIPGLRGVEFGGSPKNKHRLLMDVKAMIEKGQIKFPRSGLWLELRRQLLAYRLQDRKLSQDAVMALAIAVRLVVRTPEGKVTSSLPFSYFEPEAPPSAKKSEGEYWERLRRRGTWQKIGDQTEWPS